MIVYKLTNGVAHDLRFAGPGHVLLPDERTLEGDRLPSIESLHEPAAGLALAQQSAAREVNTAAEATRLRHITPGAGQALTYIRKAERAREWAKGSYSGAVPALVQAKATAAGMTAQQAADLIIATADAWEALAATIEQAREYGKRMVAEAKDVPAVEAARDAALASLAKI